MNRFIIVNKVSKVYAGIYYSRLFAEQDIEALQDKWLGLEWQVQESECGFPVPGLIHIGEVRAASILNRHISDIEPKE